MFKQIEDIFNELWLQYISHTPSALAIHTLLKNKQGSDKKMVNDHIALRTFNSKKLGLNNLAQHFVNLGYQEKGSYVFKQKKLKAKHYEPPAPHLPKVFISELCLEQCSVFIQNTVSQLSTYVDDDKLSSSSFVYSGRHWPINSQTYLKLAQESEYAAWLYIWGYTANHFTIDVNQLSAVDSLFALNKILKQAGYKLNYSGGEIKGSAALMLEQSSTFADKVDVVFVD